MRRLNFKVYNILTMLSPQNKEQSEKVAKFLLYNIQLEEIITQTQANDCISWSK